MLKCRLAEDESSVHSECISVGRIAVNIMLSPLYRCR